MRQIESTEILDIIEATILNGGYTADNKKAGKFNGSGYLVEQHGQVIRLGLFNVQAVSNYLKRANEKGLSGLLGTWFDKDIQVSCQSDGNPAVISIGISKLFPNTPKGRDSALRLGKRLGEKAIGHIVKGEYINDISCSIDNYTIYPNILKDWR